MLRDGPEPAPWPTATLGAERSEVSSLKHRPTFEKVILPYITFQVSHIVISEAQR